MNVDFRGRTKQILKSMVEDGYANTQSEAARLAVIQFGEGHFNEVKLVNKKLDRIDQDIKAGKRKLLDSDQALGAYAKYAK